MAHFIFNFSGDGEAADKLLRSKMWGIASDEPHRDELGPGDLVLIYLAAPERVFVGRTELASEPRNWTSSDAYPGDSPSGVLLSQVEEWDPAVPMDDVVARLDPTGSNPYVQANAKDGFQMGVVRITEHEYDSVLAIRRNAQAT